MAKNLMIIESPNKTETIGKFLNKDWKIIATVGHIRDLKKSGGYDDKTLEAHWIIINDKKRNRNQQAIIDTILEEGKKASKIYIATDPDREGEAIAWHVYEVLPKAEQAKVERITFNEITKETVVDAIAHPRKINTAWVHSQFARRILDRMVGFGLSKLARMKLHGQSAGRVQSVALKIIYDREQEIKKFKSTTWFTLDATIEKSIKLILREIPQSAKTGVKLFVDPKYADASGIDFADKESANKILKKLGKEYKVYGIDNPSHYTSNPSEPFKTSTLQQTAISSLGWSVGKVTTCAQRLYEGIKLNGEHQALISYPRTDAIRLADSFIAKAKKFITSQWGDEYFVTRTFAGKKENVQDAHEGIRVIDPYLTPASLKEKIPADEYKLYKLIWCRTLASMMPAAKYERVTVRIDNNDFKFYTYNKKLIYDGYRKVYGQVEGKANENDIGLDSIKIGKVFKSVEVEVKQHESSPPARYNQASLIKTLDEEGVGRPSTYRTMAQVNLDRGYVKLESKAFVMTPLGNDIIENLAKFFPYVIDVKFTREMEEHLDEIAKKSEGWKDWVLAFQPHFKKELAKADEGIKRAGPEKAGRLCPKCGAELVKRYSRKVGKYFIGCSNFPICDYHEFEQLPNHHAQELLEENCPLCGKPLAVRYNRRGQKFIGCTGFPKCHYVRTFGMTDEEYQKEKAAKLEAKAKGTKYTPVTAKGKELAKSEKAAAPAKDKKQATKKLTKKAK